MTYDQFILQYPWFDLILELFKGIVPTMVALSAIFINNRRAIKRDINNKKKDILVNINNTMLTKFIELSQMHWRSGSILLNYLPESNEDKRKSLFYEYSNSLYDFLYKAQEINDFYQTLFKSFKIEIDCEKVVVLSKQYSDILNDIAEKYSMYYEYPDEEFRERKYDEAAKETLEATRQIKDWCNNTMVLIADNINENLNK